MREYGLSLLVAAALTFLVLPAVRALALRAGAVAGVRDRDVHDHAIPRWGGLGMFAGLLTVYVMFFNGLMIGTVAAVVHRRGVDLGFWSFVAPHGVIELTSIFIAGGAGLILGYALVNPGPFTRGAALKLAAREAVQLVMGVILLLIPAGLIEGFLSPAVEVSPLFKLLFAALMGTFLCAYLFLCGLSHPTLAFQRQVAVDHRYGEIGGGSVEGPNAA